MPLEFLDLLSQIPDPRCVQGKKWQLGPVMLAAILAFLSGATSYRKVYGFMAIHRIRLNAAFGFGWRAAPAYSAIRTILHGLDGAEVERAFRRHAAGLSACRDEDCEDAPSLPVVAIDGKNLQHSFDAFNDRKAAHLLSAFTLDAMHCQKNFLAARELNSHLLVQLKGNQAGLLAKAKTIAAHAAPLELHESIDGNRRKRHERRRIEVFDAVPELGKSQWHGLIARLIRVTRTTLSRRAKDGMWQRREEIPFYLCSAEISAKKAAKAIRSHWSVENRNHYIRDVDMQEDASRIWVNPAIFALNILRANGENNIADALWCNALDIERVLKYRFK